MIQGGGMTRTSATRRPAHPIKNEAKNGLKNTRGTLSMARTSDINSATSQFFVNLVDNAFLDNGPRDYGYAVFGRVTEGMDIVDKIAKVKTGRRKGYQDAPMEDVMIVSARTRRGEVTSRSRLGRRATRSMIGRGSSNGSLLAILACVRSICARSCWPLRWVDPPTSAFMLEARLHALAEGDHAYRTDYEWVDLEQISPHAAIAVDRLGRPAVSLPRRLRLQLHPRVGTRQ